MKVLVLNTGSSSLKWGLFDVAASEGDARKKAGSMPTRESPLSGTARALASGSVSRIGLPDTELVVGWGEDTPSKVERGSLRGHGEAISSVLDLLHQGSPRAGALRDLDEIEVVGHRVVHGGERFSQPLVITDRSIRDIEELNRLAPLHNPHNLKGIETAADRLPQSVQVAVFDTAFHATLPPDAFLYPIPFALYRRYGIRRYGFHGISHQYVTARAARLLGRPLHQLKLISCHLGNGAGVAAVDGGRSVDTSMGFTPLAGLVMGTRSGDLDPGALLYIMEREHLDADDATYMLNHDSGLYGICGASDMRDVENRMEQGDHRAALAFRLFAYRLRKYIGAYASAMSGVDAILFTGGIGEHSSLLRAAVLRPLRFLGVQLDSGRNLSTRGERGCITHPNSKVEAWVIPTHEELSIALQAASTVARAPAPLPVLS